MSGDTQVDSDGTVQVGLDFGNERDSAATDAGAVSDPTGGSKAAGEGGDDSAGKDGDKLEKRVHDTQEALREAQKELHATKAELSRQAELLAEQRGKLSVLTERASEPEETDWLDDPKLAEQYETDPVGTLKELIARQRAEVAKVMRARDEHWQGILSSRDPKRDELKAELSVIEKDASLAKMSDDHKIAVAKMLHESKAVKSIPAPAGSPGGTGRSGGTVTGAAATSQAEKIAKSIWPDMGTSGKRDEGVPFTGLVIE